MRILLITILFISCLFSSEYIKQSKEFVDNSYGYTQEYLSYTSDYLDRKISQENYEIASDKVLRAEFAYESIFEDGKDKINDSIVKVRVLFPRLKDKYNLILENYKTNDSIDNQKPGDDYLLSLSQGKVRVGLKFRGIKPDIFAGYTLKYQSFLADDIDFKVENKFLYFADYELDNTFSIDFSKEYGDNTITLHNSYRFQEEYKDKHELIHSLSLNTSLEGKRSLNYTLSSYATKDNDKKDLEVEYYYLGNSYKEFYYKDWAYFQIDSGLIFRDENDFDPRGRLMLKMGIVFGRFN